MKTIRIVAPVGPLVGVVDLPISKSVANRYQIIAALSGGHIEIPREGAPEDVRILHNALNETSSRVDVGLAGMDMRFMTAFLSLQQGKSYRLTGSDRMKHRPIGPLVTALLSLGADIEYLGEEGFPPLAITGKELTGGTVQVDAKVSSQFVSALMLIAPYLANGLRIVTGPQRISEPYIRLTADCMTRCGAEVEVGSDIIVKQGEYHVSEPEIETDWTAASYFYAMAALRQNSSLRLKGLRIPSAQGDSILAAWMKRKGVSTVKCSDGIDIASSGIPMVPPLCDFKNNPDLAQTFAFLAACSGKETALTGLDNLRVKETDRVAAIRSELLRVGMQVSVSGNSLMISGLLEPSAQVIRTYNDHRMAMSAVLLSLALGDVVIENPDVVNKSFPLFWEQLKKLGFTIEQI